MNPSSTNSPYVSTSKTEHTPYRHVTILDIAGAIEEKAPLSLQESWDISGWQTTPMPPATTECTGVLLCLDVTTAVIDEAASLGCNLIVSHHPLLFKAVRSLTGATPAQRAIMRAIALGIDIYSAHTSLDSAPEVGVSIRLARQLGLTDISPLSPSASHPGAGLGAVGTLADAPLSRADFIALVKRVYSAPAVRITSGPDRIASTGIRRVALCSGSGGEFIADAIAAGADAYISSDIRYHDFLDYGGDILLVDTCHWESEICTKSIFSEIISQKFPNFAVNMSTCEPCPVAII